MFANNNRFPVRLDFLVLPESDYSHVQTYRRPFEGSHPHSIVETPPPALEELDYQLGDLGKEDIPGMMDRLEDIVITSKMGRVPAPESISYLQTE